MVSNQEARPEKVAQVAEVAEQFRQANAAVLTDYRGLSVAAMAELRARLREADAEYKVVKNTLTRRAVRDAGVDVPDEVLVGPTAVTFCAGDAVAAAKVLRSFSKQYPGLVIKAGVLEGEVLDAAAAERLADLESREELLAKLAGMFGTILAQPARLAQANLEKAARLFAALKDKLPEDGGAPESVGESTTAEETDTEETSEEQPGGDEESGDSDKSGDGEESGDGEDAGSAEEAEATPTESAEE